MSRWQCVGGGGLGGASGQESAATSCQCSFFALKHFLPPLCFFLVMGLACFDDPEAEEAFWECEEEEEMQGFAEMEPPFEPAPEPAASSFGCCDDSVAEDDVSYLEALLPEAEVTVEPTATEATHLVDGSTDLGDMPVMKLRRVGLAPNEAESTTASTVHLSPFQQWLNDLTVKHEEEVLSKHFWHKLTGTQVYNYLYDKLRGFYAKKIHALRPETGKEFALLSGRERQREARRAFQELSNWDKKYMAFKWVAVTQPPKFIQQSVTMHFKLDEVDAAGRLEKSMGALFTWILPETALGELSLPPPPASPTLEDVVARVRSHSNLQELWDTARDHGKTVLRLVGGTDVAISLEVCPDTWELQKAVKLHVHCFVLSVSGVMRWKLTRVYHLSGIAPHVSQTDPTGCSIKGRNLWSGFLYCCLTMKRGTVCCDSTKAPFTGFRVNPNWIMNSFQGGKLDRVQTRALLVRCVNASRFINELDKNEAELERAAIVTAQREAQQLLAVVEKPVKSYPKVTAFVNQFKVTRHRYKFLVLAGPSKVGKTAFARTLCDPLLETLEINCAGGAEPDLRAYRLSRHGLILFDEIKGDQVAHQRKLFQAGSSEVQMGCSATNCHSYPVFVWRKKLVLASNCWHESVASLPPDAQDWIKCNSIVLDVTEKMYYE